MFRIVEKLLDWFRGRFGRGEKSPVVMQAPEPRAPGPSALQRQHSNDADTSSETETETAATVTTTDDAPSFPDAHPDESPSNKESDMGSEPAATEERTDDSNDADEIEHETATATVDDEAPSSSRASRGDTTADEKWGADSGHAAAEEKDDGSIAAGDDEANSADDGNDKPADDEKSAAEVVIAPKPPPRIGGKRGTQRKQKSDSGKTAVAAFTPGPEFICREIRNRWEILLVVPDESKVAEVRQGDAVLSASDGEYRIQHFAAAVAVRFNDDTVKPMPLFTDKPLVFTDKPLVFKAAKDWGGDGRRVGGITRGFFVVVAPRQWKRTGHAPVEHARCADAKFAAHYFHVDDSSRDAGGFEECALSLTKSKFELHGETLFDRGEDGMLFVGMPPRLKTEAVWARVGYEGVKGGWGENFQPADKALAEVLANRQGRFFIRVYDDNAKLLDAGQFRYHSSLQAILVDGKPYSQDMVLLPGARGHSDSRIRFAADDGSNLRPRLNTNHPHVRFDEDGVMVVAPHKDGDDLSFSLGDGESRIAMWITLPRVWWRINRTDEQGAWAATCAEMTRAEFRAHASDGSELELSLPANIKSVRVGFGDALNLPYPNGDALPFVDFVDCEEMDERYTDAWLQFRCGDSVVQLIRLAADALPKPEKPVQPPPPPTGHVQVKYLHGQQWRRGAGFSHGELAAAGLTPADADRLKLSLDKRRGSVHTNNIALLNQIKSDA